MQRLSEETITLVQQKLLEPDIMKKLRETPMERFKDAPGGEKVSR